MTATAPQLPPIESMKASRRLDGTWNVFTLVTVNRRAKAYGRQQPTMPTQQDFLDIVQLRYLLDDRAGRWLFPNGRFRPIRPTH